MLGLNGTGSIDYGLDDVYVPEEFTHLPNALVAQQGGNLYRIGIVGMSPLGHTGFTLGLGRRILDELFSLVHAPSGRPSPLAEFGGADSFQEDFAAAEGELRAGRAFCYEVWGGVAATLDRGGPLAARRFTLMRLALGHITTTVVEIATFAHRAGGGVAIRSGILQRCFRDMFTATQHRRLALYAARMRPRTAGPGAGQGLDGQGPRRSGVTRPRLDRRGQSSSVMDAFVDAHDLAELGFEGVEPAESDGPPFVPRLS